MQALFSAISLRQACSTKWEDSSLWMTTLECAEDDLFVIIKYIILTVNYFVRSFTIYIAIVTKKTIFNI